MNKPTKKNTRPDLQKQYYCIQKLIDENEAYINRVIDEQRNAEYKGDFERKRELEHIEANMQHVVNLMYEVTGFIENKWFG